MPQQRLQKILAAAGIASRRKSEQLILDGAVQVNGKTVNSLPAFADPDTDTISVNGKKIKREPKVYFLLNKPKGVVCTNSDPYGRTKAVDLVPSPYRIFCAGRLDADTSGLIILTNDNQLTNRLTHPRYKLPKTYLAAIKGKVSPAAVENLKKGIWLAEGKTRPARVKIIQRGHNRSMLEITITQGINRQIRRMLAKVNLPVKSLKRTQISSITDKGLGIGKFRPLTKKEITHLRKKNQPETLTPRNSFPF